MKRGRATPAPPPLSIRLNDLPRDEILQAIPDEGEVWEVEAVKIWECVICQRRETWCNGWRWYGSLDLEEDGHVVPLCSDACQESYNREFLHRWPPTIDESGRAVKRRRGENHA